MSPTLTLSFCNPAIFLQAQSFCPQFCPCGGTEGRACCQKQGQKVEALRKDRGELVPSSLQMRSPAVQSPAKVQVGGRV
jgi:hypothetical protein